MRAAFALGVLAWAAAAQDRPETVIRTTTRLVEIRVMAENSKGEPVTDLRKEELQLLDNRHPRAIEFLAFEGGIAPANTPAAAGASAAARDDYAVILLDWMNPGMADRLRARDSVNKLLGSFRPRQQVALYLLAKQSRLLHDFTSNPSELLETLANTEEEPEDPFSPKNRRVSLIVRF